jgi:hypothetical protein
MTICRSMPIRPMPAASSTSAPRGTAFRRSRIWPQSSRPLQVDHRIGHRRQLRRLRHEELALVARPAQHLALHRHEHALAVGIQRAVGLVAEQRRVAPPGVLRQVQRHRPGQALVDPDPFAAAHQADALALAGLAVVHDDVEALLLLALAVSSSVWMDTVKRGRSRPAAGRWPGRQRGPASSMASAISPSLLMQRANRFQLASSLPALGLLLGGLRDRHGRRTQGSKIAIDLGQRGLGLRARLLPRREYGQAVDTLACSALTILCPGQCLRGAGKRFVSPVRLVQFPLDLLLLAGQRATWVRASGMRACASRASPSSLQRPCRSVPEQGTSAVRPKRWASSCARSTALPASRSMPASFCSARRTAPLALGQQLDLLATRLRARPAQFVRALRQRQPPDRLGRPHRQRRAPPGSGVATASAPAAAPAPAAAARADSLFQAFQPLHLARS